MKKIIIELPDNGGYSIKGTDELENRSECVWAILGARRAEEMAIEKGYLKEIKSGIEKQFDMDGEKLKLLIGKDSENISLGDQVSPTYLTIELPKNVPLGVKPIVILPNMNGETVLVKIDQYGSFCGSFELKTDLSQSQIINLNTGV